MTPGAGAGRQHRSLRRLRWTPPRPATAIRVGFAQRLRVGWAGVNDSGPEAAPHTQVLRQIQQRPLGAGWHLHVEVGRGGSRRGRARRRPRRGRRSTARRSAAAGRGTPEPLPRRLSITALRQPNNDFHGCHGSRAGGHRNGQPRGGPDSHGRHEATPPMSRTALNRPGRRYRDVRIRRPLRAARDLRGMSLSRSVI